MGVKLGFGTVLLYCWYSVDVRSLGAGLLSRPGLNSEVSIDNQTDYKTEMKFNNMLDLNDITDNDQRKHSGIMAIPQFAIFLTFNFENSEVYAFDVAPH